MDKWEINIKNPWFSYSKNLRFFLIYGGQSNVDNGGN